jgi:hypothetical protein
VHEAREVLVIGPEGEHLLHRRIDVDGLLHHDAVVGIGQPDQRREALVRRRAGDEGAAGDAEERAHARARPERGRDEARAEGAGGKARRRRPVLLHELEAAAAWTAALQR